MKYTKDKKHKYEVSLLRVDITQEQKLKAKKLAKRKGMTFQGWLGQLVIKEITYHQEASK